MHKNSIQQTLVSCLFLLSTCTLHAQSPGGVGRQSIWLQGDLFQDTTRVQTLNFNPATIIDNHSPRLKMPDRLNSLGRATIFTVYQSPGAQQEMPVWQMTGNFGDLLLSTRQVSSKSGKMNMVFVKKATGASLPQTVVSTYLRRQRAQAVAENAENKEPVMLLGGPGSSPGVGQPDGLIGEFILYETVLKEKDIAKIETYLALKYGVTLEKNYLNSEGETIWNRKNDKLYSNSIAGIGRDDRSALYQKQGTSSNDPGQLIIGINQIARTNSRNTGRLNNLDYLIWGDNAMPFRLEQKKKTESDTAAILLSEKKWLMKTVGQTAQSISTELRIDTRKLLPAYSPGQRFCMVIDRSGYGDFAGKDCAYVFPDSISADGIASFSRIFWDTDGSGKDVFTFGVKPVLSTAAEDPNSNGNAKLLFFRVYPNPVTNGRYTIAISLEKPTDITIQLYDVHLRLIHSQKMSGQSYYLLSGNLNAAAGTYLVKVLTPGKEFSKVIVRQ